MPLSPELEAHLAELLTASPSTEAELRWQVHAHLAAAEAQAAESPLVDVSLARRLAAAHAALLDGWDTLSEPHQRLVQASCVYFVRTADDDHDLYSVLGFEDDAALLNHVAVTVGRADLVVEVE